MNPDDMDDAQLMRMVTLGMAVVMTHRHEPDGSIFDVADAFAAYIETGERP